MFEKIPTMNCPQIKNVSESLIVEPIVSLSSFGLLCDSQYYKQKIQFAINDCYARKHVAEKLVYAQYLLPKGYHFKIYDAYRPIEVQQALWNKYQEQLLAENPEISEQELDSLTRTFVSKPSEDLTPPHNTGGAIDLTIIDKSGKELDMGTDFDDFSEKAWTAYFEENNISDIYKENRRILYNVMIKAGFTNLPSEWWHYDFGNSNWAYYKNTDIIYGAIQTSEVLINAK